MRMIRIAQNAWLNADRVVSVMKEIDSHGRYSVRINIAGGDYIVCSKFGSGIQDGIYAEAECKRIVELINSQEPKP